MEQHSGLGKTTFLVKANKELRIIEKIPDEKPKLLSSWKCGLSEEAGPECALESAIAQ